MASEQLRREKKSEIKENVPKVTHFESLTVTDSSNQPASADVVRTVTETSRVSTQAAQKHKGAEGPTLTTTKIIGEQQVPVLTEKRSERADDKQSKTQHSGSQVAVKKPMAKDSSSERSSGEVKGEKATGLTDTMEDVGAKGARYVGEKASQGKDVAVEAGKTTAEFAGKAAGVAKDAALVAGWGAAELASGTTKGATETMESLNDGVSRTIEGAAVGAEVAGEKAIGFTETVIDAGKRGAKYIGEKAVAGKDTTMDAGKRTAGAVKDATLVAGWSAAELASETDEGVRESMGNLNAGVARAVDGAAVAAETVAEQAVGVTDTAIDAGKKGANLVGKTVIGGKDIALQTGKTAVDYAGKASGNLTLGVKETMGSLNTGVGGAIENTARAAEAVGEKVIGATGTAVDLGKKGVVAGKDITLKTGKTAAEYTMKGAEAAKDAALVGGWSAAELASDATKGVSESMENVNTGVAGFVENAAIAAEVATNKAAGLKDVVVDAGKKGASYGKEATLKAGKTTAEYAGKGADAAKDAALVAGWGAAEAASGTAAGVTDYMEFLNKGVAGLVEGAASLTENVAGNAFDTMVNVGKSGASYIGETGKAAAGYVGATTGVVKDAALVGGWSAAELASHTTKGVSESLQNVDAGVAGLVENTAVATEVATEKATGLKNVVEDIGKKGVNYGKDVTLEAGKTTREYAGKAADVAKDATLVAGWSAAELASAAATGVGESVRTLNTGVERFVEGTATATEVGAEKVMGLKDTAVDIGRKGASYAGQAATAGKDIALGAGNAATAYVGAATDVAKDAGSITGQTKGSGGTKERKPEEIVVEREKISVEYPNREKTEKETKKVYQQGGSR